MVKDVLRRKLVRDMWHNRMQFLAVILLCALGTWVFSGLDAAWRMLDLSAQTYFDEQNVADVWITLSSADREAMAAQIAKKMFHKDKVICRVSDSHLQLLYHRIYGLETICPTILTEQAVFRALAK